MPRRFTSTVPPEDEFVHNDYPKECTNSWKENWYFNFLDRKNNACGFNHISIERHLKRVRFAGFHVIDGEPEIYLNYIPVGDDFKDMTDGTLRFDIIKPHEEWRVTFDGPKYSLDLHYLAHGDVYDFNAEEDLSGQEGDFLVKHYEQALSVKGTLTKGGATRPIVSLAARDHTWGYREEENILGWRWVSIHLKDVSFLLGVVHVKGKPRMAKGFVSEESGNSELAEIDIFSTKLDEEGAPYSSVFELTDKKGRIWRLTSDKFSSMKVPASPTREEVFVYENFAEYTLEQTGEKGVGIDEYTHFGKLVEVSK